MLHSIICGALLVPDFASTREDFFLVDYVDLYVSSFTETYVLTNGIPKIFPGISCADSLSHSTQNFFVVSPVQTYRSTISHLIPSTSSHSAQPSAAPTLPHQLLPPFTATTQLQNSVAYSLSQPKDRPQENVPFHGKQELVGSTQSEECFHPYRRPSGNQQGKQTNTNQSFPVGAGRTGSFACVLCLVCFHHNIHKCAAELLWDGCTKTHCSRNSAGHLVNPEGQELCYDWQRPNSCTNTSHSHVHECSGCRSKEHSAQGCSLSETL